MPLYKMLRLPLVRSGYLAPGNAGSVRPDDARDVVTPKSTLEQIKAEELRLIAYEVFG